MIEHAASIVAAYLGNHNVASEQIPAIIASVHAALNKLGSPVVMPMRLTPAVPIRKSVQPEQITCLDCGWKGQMLKRHIAVSHGLDPEQYRERWGLSPDYPITAPNYTAKRSQLAKDIGLGTTTPERQKEDPLMFGIVFVRSIGVLCGLGALLLTVFLAWAVIGGARDTHADYGPQHYAGPLSTAHGWNGQH